MASNDYREYAPLSGEAADFWDDVTSTVSEYKEYIKENIAPCREISLAMTAFDEAVLWARKALDEKGFTPNA